MLNCAGTLAHAVVSEVLRNIRGHKWDVKWNVDDVGSTIILQGD